VASDTQSFETSPLGEAIPSIQHRYVSEANEEVNTAMAAAHNEICMAIYSTLTTPSAASSATNGEQLSMYQSAPGKLSAVAK
jgi:hypothetical protein